MLAGTLAFELFPADLLSIFATRQSDICKISVSELRIIGISFVPISAVLIIRTYFQAIGKGFQSIFNTVFRQLILLIPLAWFFSKFGLVYV